MILKRMVLENFRQFKGRQEIIFSEGDVSGSKPCITVLYGENGRGKTGIYRALMFGLYGDAQLSQDDNIADAELNLVNLHLLDTQRGKEIIASVDLEFSHNNRLYSIRREIQGMKTADGKILKQTGQALLRVQDERGNTTPHTDPQDILREISDVLDYRVREYFLFDGERIERLTKANAEQRKEVSAGIRNLLDIDNLELSIKAANTLRRELDQEVKRRSTGELQQVVREINEKEDEIKSAQEALANSAKELLSLKRERVKIDDALKKYQGIRSLVVERESLEHRLDELRDILTNLDNGCRQISSKNCFAIINPILSEVYEKLDGMYEKGDIPPAFRADFIDRLLKRGECICGRSLEKDSPPFMELLGWKSKAPKNTETDAALRIWNHLETIRGDIPSRRREAQNHLELLATTQTSLNNSLRRHAELTEAIGEDERADAQEQEGMRKRNEEQHLSLLANQAARQSVIDRITPILTELEKKRTRLENDESFRDSLTQRSQMCRQVKDALENVFTIFKKEAATVLGQYATEIMLRLLDEEGRKNLKKITVQDDYSLQIMDQWEGQFLANISAGQRQIMSISFITALARAASADTILEMPLFMDTPFGRLSQTHRNNLIREVPNLCSQWVLLATDTELRREEGQVLLKEKRLGRFYCLTAAADGTTSITEKCLSNVPALLKTKLENDNV